MSRAFTRVTPSGVARISGLLAFVAAAVAVTVTCRSATSPSEPVQDNLSEAPPSAHSLSVSDLTVRFWLEVDPPRNTAIAPGTPVRLTVRCRHSRYVTDPIHWVHLEFQHVASDGSPWLAPTRPFGSYMNLASYWCGGNGAIGAGNTLPPTFPGLSELRIRAWIVVGDQGSAGPSEAPGTPPDGEFVEPINWTLAR